MESKGTINREITKFSVCPKCKKGEIVHIDNYFCNADGCNFVIFKEMFGVKISKSMMMSLVTNYFLEKYYTDLILNKKEVSGFLYLDKESYQVKIIFPNKLAITRCPKCKKNDVFMKYSLNNDSFFYGCKDYKECKFTLPYSYFGAKLKFKDVKKLCALDPIRKQLVSRKNQKYTVDIFINNSTFKITQKRGYKAQTYENVG